MTTLAFHIPSVVHGGVNTFECAAVLGPQTSRSQRVASSATKLQHTRKSQQRRKRICQRPRPAGALFLHGWRRCVCREAQVTLIELNRDTKEIRVRHQSKKQNKQPTTKHHKDTKTGQARISSVLSGQNRLSSNKEGETGQ